MIWVGMPNDPCFLKGKRGGDLEVETDGSLGIIGQPAYLGGSRIVPQGYNLDST